MTRPDPPAPCPDALGYVMLWAVRAVVAGLTACGWVEDVVTGRGRKAER